MFISKHHYALELSKLGNKVFYVNGPAYGNALKKGEVKIEPSGYSNLSVVKHRFLFPRFLAFKARPLFDFFVRLHIKKMVSKISPEGELIVWSFDLSNTIPLKFFPATSFKIFMPVDEPLVPRAIEAAQSADVIFSVTQEIIDKYKQYNIPSLFINHGVGAYFINEQINTVINTPLSVGLSGNFFRPDIDRSTLLKIIRTHPGIFFNFWGSTSMKKANTKGKLNDSLGANSNDRETLEFIEALNSCPNVVMHGSVKPEILCKELQQPDAFLICYDINKDQSKGTNYHKVLEYLATGKLIISNNITTYQQYPGLFLMNASRDNNDELPALFTAAISQLATHNRFDKQQQRIDFAKKYGYEKQINKIENFITEKFR